MVFGTDYPTRDGTCIRDYIHVKDLIDAHILALNALFDGKTGRYNLGSGEGYSVKEIIETCREVTGHPIPDKEVERRSGDSSELVASSKKIKKELGWKPKFGAREIVEDSWKWHKSHPDGF